MVDVEGKKVRRKGKGSLKTKFARTKFTLKGTKCLLREPPTATPQLPTHWQHSEFQRISEFCFLKIETIWSLFLEFLREWKNSENSQAISSNTSASLGIKPSYLKVTCICEWWSVFGKWISVRACVIGVCTCPRKRHFRAIQPFTSDVCVFSSFSVLLLM